MVNLQNKCWLIINLKNFKLFKYLPVTLPLPGFMGDGLGFGELG